MGFGVLDLNQGEEEWIELGMSVRGEVQPKGWRGFEQAICLKRLKSAPTWKHCLLEEDMGC